MRTSLSPGEQKVEKLVVKGLSNKKISSILGVTEKTVKFHLTNIYAKLGIKSRAELIFLRNRESEITIDELKLFKTLLIL